MPSEPELISSFFGLIKAGLGAALRPEAESLLEACDENIILEFPYAPEAGVSRLEGKAALAAYLPKVASTLEIDEFHLDTVHASDGGRTFVLEFSCTGKGAETGVPYNQDYISVIYVENGLIVRYRDYWNPQILLAAMGGEAALARSFEEEVN